MTEHGTAIDGTDVRVHVVQSGSVVGNRTFLRGEGFASLLRRPQPYAFPVLCWVLEHPEGLIAVDTGITSRVRIPSWQQRLVPRPVAEPGDELGPQLRLRGLDPRDVRRVVLTHLDWDHAGGLAHVPEAEVLVHRPEHAFATGFPGRARCRPELWPDGFTPALYDLDDEPAGPFPRSRAVTERGDVRVVPLPGHSPGQVGVLVQGDGVAVLLSSDHLLRQAWFLQDVPAGRLVQLGAFGREDAIETSRRIARLVTEVPTLLLPSHDDEAPARLAAGETCPPPGALARRPVPLQPARRSG